MQRRSPGEPRTHRSASLRPRRSRPPAQGCGHKTATLGQRPAKRFNPNGVAPHTPFSHPYRPEPLCGSIATPPIPRVGLIPFGQPRAGGRKPFGLGGRAPVLSILIQTHSSPNAEGIPPFSPAASLRPRRSQPPAQGCGRKTATLGPCPAKRFNPNGVAPYTPFSHPYRPEPLCGSIGSPPIPRGRPHSIRPTPGWRLRALRAGFRPPIHPRTRLEGDTQSPMKRRSARFRFTHATISLRRLSARGFLNQRTPSISTESGTPRLVARLSGWNFQKPPMCATEDRGRGGSCAHSRPPRPNDHPTRVGQGTETRIKSLAQRTNCPANTPGSAKRALVSVRVAKWLCVFLGQRFQSPVRYSLHRRAGRASSQNHLPSGITGTVEKARRDLGRKIPLGLAACRTFPPLKTNLRG